MSAIQPTVLFSKANQFQAVCDDIKSGQIALNKQTFQLQQKFEGLKSYLQNQIDNSFLKKDSGKGAWTFEVSKVIKSEFLSKIDRQQLNNLKDLLNGLTEGLVMGDLIVFPAVAIFFPTFFVAYSCIILGVVAMIFSGVVDIELIELAIDLLGCMNISKDCNGPPYKQFIEQVVKPCVGWEISEEESQSPFVKSLYCEFVKQIKEINQFYKASKINELYPQIICVA